MLFNAAAKRLPKLQKPLLALTAGALILASAALINSDYRGLISEAVRFWPGRGQDQYLYQKVCREAADYVRLNSAPEDKLQVWGAETIINFFAQRRAPSRMPYTLYLVPLRPGAVSPLQKELSRELLRQMQADPPRFFIVTRLPYFENEDLGKVLANDYPGLRGFIEANYLHDHNVSRFEIYRLNR